MKKIMIVDDDRDLRSIVRDVLSEEGFSITEAKDGMNAVRMFREQSPDAVLLDMKMPYMNGIETLQELKKMDSSVPVIILTAHGDIPTAVEAIKCGAYDFAIKPPEFDRLVIMLKRAVERRELEMEVLRSSTALKASLENMFGKSPAIRTVVGQIEQVARTDFSVIIEGETGTGKSVVASAIHSLSRREDKPFVSVDIGLIPDLLVESELFGYKKGAFTGADRDKAGYFETAHKGTIFIDEMENMSPHMQAKLLSFIEKKKMYPLGSTNPVDVDVRIIAATNKDIRKSVIKKEFREDLFYRIGEFIIALPPLRKRVEDIPFFVNKFAFEACTEMNRQIKEIAGDAIDVLMKHDWPGNLRELKNVVRRAVLLMDSDIMRKECIDSLLLQKSDDRFCTRPSSLKDALKEVEKQMIIDALKKAGGNKAGAADLLGVSYQHIYNKIKEYEIR
ncbi:MAG: sigma-54 dependent transcriptional regulator [Nitrospirota bacterium]